VPGVDQDRVSWSTRKANANAAKHGVSFLAARSALRDPSLRIWPDIDHQDVEDRFVMLGIDLHGRLLFMVTQELPDGTIRLISARRATKREEDVYTTGAL